jgi:hypothetical protein
MAEPKGMYEMCLFMATATKRVFSLHENWTSATTLGSEPKKRPAKPDKMKRKNHFLIACDEFLSSTF